MSVPKYAVYCSILLICSCSALNTQDSPEPDAVKEEAMTLPGAIKIADNYYRTQKNDLALYYYLKVIELDINNIPAREKIALIHKSNGNQPLAVAVYNDIYLLDNNNAIALQEIGLYHLSKKNLTQAKVFINKALVIKKDLWKSHDALGVIADLEARFKDAINHYETALALKPNNPVILNNIGYSLYSSGKRLKANQFYKQALKYNKNYQPAINNLALSETVLSHYDSAFSLFNSILEDYDAYNNMGYICMINGQYSKAEEFFNKAVSLSPFYFPKAQSNIKLLKTMRTQAAIEPRTPQVKAKPRRIKKIPQTSPIVKKASVTVPPQDRINKEKSKPAQIVITKDNLSIEKPKTKPSESKAISTETIIPQNKAPILNVNNPTTTSVVKDTIINIDETSSTKQSTSESSKPIIPKFPTTNIDPPVAKEANAIPPLKKNTSEAVIDETESKSLKPSEPVVKPSPSILPTKIEADAHSIVPNANKAVVAPITKDIKAISLPKEEAVEDSHSSLISNTQNILKPSEPAAKQPSPALPTKIEVNVPNSNRQVPAPAPITNEIDATYNLTAKPFIPTKSTSTESILKSIQIEIERTTKQPLLLDTDMSDQKNNILLNEKITEKKTVSEPELLYDD